jgi:Tat protein translocase TatB subunit
MPNLGAGEIIVILLVALIVLGPQRLPDAARQVGKAMTELKRVSTGFQNEFRSSMDEVTMADEDLSLNAQKRLTQRDDPPGIAVAADEVSRQGTPRAKPGRPRRTTPLRAAPDPGDADAAEHTES